MMAKDQCGSSEGGQKDLDFGSLLNVGSMGFGAEPGVGHDQEV